MNTSMKLHALGAAILATVLVAGPVTTVQAADTVALEFGERKPTDLRLAIGQSQIIQSAVPLEQVVIGSPDVADIKLLSSRRVLILGIKPGRTNLVFRQKDGDLVALMEVSVGYDLTGIKYKLHELMPHEPALQVRDTNDRVILSGEVSSALAMDKALSVARSFVPAEKVTNLLQVAGGQQVMLEARIAEVSRSSMKELGIEGQFLDGSGKWGVVMGKPLASPYGTVSPQTFISPLASAVTAPVNGVLNQVGNVALPPNSLRLSLQALEEKGLAKTLAEPNIVALSGQEANFLAGGEYPIPVAQAANNGTVTVEYKTFGVGLRFTPTVLDSDKINLKLLSEVSEVDATNTLLLNNLRLPSFATRRAGTTVELADGQSFAIAGLMSNSMDNAVSQFPVLGNIPVIGALFRSSKFQRNESELVVVVTARLVGPVNKGRLALPTDVILPPNDVDQYLLGRMHGRHKDRPEASSTGSAMAPASGGLEGMYGHQLNRENGNVRK